MRFSGVPIFTTRKFFVFHHTLQFFNISYLVCTSLLLLQLRKEFELFFISSSLLFLNQIIRSTRCSSVKEKIGNRIVGNLEPRAYVLLRLTAYTRRVHQVVHALGSRLYPPSGATCCNAISATFLVEFVLEFFRHKFFSKSIYHISLTRPFQQYICSYLKENFPL